MDQALARSGVAPTELAGLATIDAKGHEPALQHLAHHLGLELQAWPAAALRRFEDRLTLRSERTYALFGCYGVAESSALASAAATNAYGDAQLVLTRMDEAHATIALACPVPTPA